MRAFKHRDFRIAWSGALLSNIGTWMMNLVLPYVFFQLTGSALWVGAVVAAQFLPMVLIGPLGGSVADHFPRRRVLLTAQSSLGVAAALIWVAWISDVRNPWLLIFLVAIVGLLNGISLPSWQAFVHDIVPREDLQSAVAMNSLQINAARAVGPAIAGLVLAAFGPATAFAINAVSYSCMVGAIALVRAGRGAHRRVVAESVTRQFVEAIRYARTQPGILMAILLALVIGFFGNPIFAFTVIFAGAVFEVGPVELGVMNAALGVGAILIAPVVGGVRFAHRTSTIAGIGLVTFGAALLAFALSPSYVLSVGLLVVLGAAFLAVIATSNTANQLIVADRFRGRILALRLMVFTIAAPIGGLAQGALSDAIGPRATLTLTSSTLLVIALWLLTKKGRVRMSRLQDPHDVTTVG